MNKKIYAVILFLIVFFIGCTNVNNNDENSLSFTGTWEVIENKYLADNEDLDESNSTNYIGEKIILADKSACIFNESKKIIRYKLKSVDKSYILSEQFDLTMEEFLKDDERQDIISIIDRGQIIGEFFINKNNNMILFYKSNLFKLKKISNNTEFKVNSDDDNTEEYKNEYFSIEGVMIGIKTPRLPLENGSYSEEEYNTIWISHNNGDIGVIYKKNDIVFPRINGIYKLKVISNIVNDKNIDTFEVLEADDNFSNNIIDNNAISSEYKSINFIGNDYMAIEKYIGDNFNGEYPIYQIVPIANINSSEGVQINEIFNNEAKGKYNEDFHKAVSNLTKDELNTVDTSNIDYSNITMERSLGKWMLISKILPKNNDYTGIDFKLSLFPNKKLINYNYLNISWKTLKSELGFFKDAYTSPNRKIALIQYDEYLAVYRIDNGILVLSPVAIIPIGENDEIIMAEWCEGSYVKAWEKSFYDGEIIMEDYETYY